LVLLGVEKMAWWEKKVHPDIKLLHEEIRATCALLRGLSDLHSRKILEKRTTFSEANDETEALYVKIRAMRWAIDDIKRGRDVDMAAFRPRVKIMPPEEVQVSRVVVVETLRDVRPPPPARSFKIELEAIRR
jgi:hypothetical protein